MSSHGEGSGVKPKALFALPTPFHRFELASRLEPNDAWVVGDVAWDSVEFTSAHAFGLSPEELGERVLATIPPLAGC